MSLFRKYKLKKQILVYISVSNLSTLCLFVCKKKHYYLNV